MRRRTDTTASLATTSSEIHQKLVNFVRRRTDTTASLAAQSSSSTDDQQSTSAAGTSGAGPSSSAAAGEVDDGGAAERQTEDAARLFRLRRHISDDTASPSRTSPSSSSDQVDASIPEVGYVLFLMIKLYAVDTSRSSLLLYFRSLLVPGSELDREFNLFHNLC